MYINNVLYCFYSSDTEALEACFRLLHDDDDDNDLCVAYLLIYNFDLWSTFTAFGVLVKEIRYVDYI